MSKLQRIISTGSVLAFGVCMMAGCTQAEEMTLDGAYSFTGVIPVEIDFHEDGTADYGYPAIYSRTDGEDGTMYIHMGYGYPSEFTKMNISTYVVEDLGDGKVSLKRLNAGEDDEARILEFEEGTEGILSTENFSGMCTANDGMMLRFDDDGTYLEYRQLDYKMDEEQLTLGSGENKTVYKYTLSEDKSELTLSNDSGSKQWDFKLLEEEKE